MSLLNNRITAVVAGSVLVVGLGATGAVAGTLITSHQIEDGTIRGKDLRPGLKARALSDSSVDGVTTDGPYPGVSNLVHGDNSTSTWTQAAGLNTSWVQCAEGETAIGGGFSRGDEGGYNDLNIVSASPALIRNGQVISITGTGLQAETVNEDWAYVPNGWVVEGFVNGEGERIVRPHVVCATFDN
jgi:hypothetical protein